MENRKTCDGLLANDHVFEIQGGGIGEGIQENTPAKENLSDCVRTAAEFAPSASSQKSGEGVR